MVERQEIRIGSYGVDERPVDWIKQNSRGPISLSIARPVAFPITKIPAEDIKARLQPAVRAASSQLSFVAQEMIDEKD